MAGLYVHIPFCKSRCIYCDFYSTTLESRKDDYVDALIAELNLRGQESWQTIYIGGGTPSRLTVEQLTRLFSAIDCSQAKEITMECNPDDITPEYAALLGRLPVNRVSMGAQTFSDERLRFVSRRHSARQVETAVRLLREAGIENLSLDLMYGFPGETLDDWQRDIDNILALQPQHISAYALMYEEGTTLFNMLAREEIKETDEETSRRMYETLIERLHQAGYEHYEISNFARPGFRSRHNSSYWNDTPYTGIGAAAHSYTGSTTDRPERISNIADIDRYISSIKQGILPQEHEPLDISTLYNDMVMLSLRTREGINIHHLRSRFGEEYYSHCMKMAQRFIDSGLLELEENSSLSTLHSKLKTQNSKLRLSRQGLFVSDMIMAELFHG